MNWEITEDINSYPHQASDVVSQEVNEADPEHQSILELVVIKDSCDVTVCITDKQFAISLQTALQVAVVVILQFYLGSSERAKEISQELFQLSKIKQLTQQKFLVSHSKNVYIESTDQQATANIQILVQLLLALVKKLNLV